MAPHHRDCATMCNSGKGQDLDGSIMISLYINLHHGESGKSFTGGPVLAVNLDHV